MMKNSRKIKIIAKILMINTIVLLVVLSAVEYFLSMQESAGKFLSESWFEENKKVYKENNKKNNYLSGKKDIWRSRYYKEHGTFKKTILVIGDSFVWGAALKNFNDVWWRQLENRLHGLGYDVDVIACGVNGWTTSDQLERVKELAGEYAPDLIIWSYVTNDADESVKFKQKGKSAVIQFDSSGYIRHFAESDLAIKASRLLGHFLPNLSYSLVSKRNEKLLSCLYFPPDMRRKVGYPYKEWELEILKGENFAEYLRTLDKVSTFVKTSGIPCFFVTLPHFLDYDYFNKRYSVVEGEFKKRGIPFVNLLSSLEEEFGHDQRDPIQWGANPADGHPGISLTNFFANEVASIIEDKYNYIFKKNNLIILDGIIVNDVSPFELSFEQNGNDIVIYYPDDNTILYKMPSGEPYVMLNFSSPIYIQSIVVEAPERSKIKIVAEVHDPSSYYLDNLYEAEKIRDKYIFHLPSREKQEIRSLRISANFEEENSDNKISMKIIN